TAGDKADARQAGGLAHRFRHDGSAAFLPADRDGKVAIMECVENREIAFAGHAESMAYAVDGELVDEHLGGRAHIVLCSHPKLSRAARFLPSPLAGRVEWRRRGATVIEASRTAIQAGSAGVSPHSLNHFMMSLTSTLVSSPGLTGRSSNPRPG